MDRQPVVAGQFYPRTAAALDQQIRDFLIGEQDKARTLLAMVPHAGYTFSGSVAGKVFARANLADTIILLGPNHTGQGNKIAVWGQGRWKIPGKEIMVDEKTASLIGQLPNFSFDHQAHLAEHSLEVVLPFLSLVKPRCRVVPIAVAERDVQILISAGHDLARTIKELSMDVSLVVSTDMSHFIPDEHARKLDAKALDKVLDLDARGLFQVVRQQNISMCGVLPMTMGLACASRLGARSSELIDYATSADAIGNYSQVVGYAGILIS